MSHKSVRGIDYLVDYYSVLGVARDAPKEEVIGAYRKKAKQYHSDRFQGLAPELLVRATETLNIVNEAYATIGDDQNRATYDALLAGWTKPISTQGEAIIDLGGEGFSLSTLLDQLALNPEVCERQAETLALQFSGFDRATYEFFEAQANSSSGIPEALKPAYLEQLSRRELYLSMREMCIWEQLGKRNHAPIPKLEYRGQVEKELEATQGQIKDNLGQQAMLLAAGERMLLGSPDGVAEENFSVPAVLREYEVRIEAHLLRQTELLIPLVEERERIMKKRFELGVGVEYFPGTTTYTDRVIVGMKSDKKILWWVMKFEGSNVERLDDLPAIENLSLPEEHPDFSVWLMGQGYTIVSFTVVSDIDPMSQLEQVLQMYYDAHLTNEA